MRRSKSQFFSNFFEHDLAPFKEEIFDFITNRSGLLIPKFSKRDLVFFIMDENIIMFYGWRGVSPHCK